MLRSSYGKSAWNPHEISGNKNSQKILTFYPAIVAMVEKEWTLVTMVVADHIHRPYKELA